ncbi:MAG: hypothetical protein ABTD50_24400, partial [Polyangiaceae bacterium]
EGDVFEAMLDSVDVRLAHLAEAFESLRSQREWPEDAAESIADESASVEAVRLDIAEIALTAIYHWIERRCALLLNHKATAAKCDDATLRRLSKTDFKDKVAELAAHGVDLARLSQLDCINKVLREFANSWKHREGPKPELLTALGIVSTVRVDLLGDNDVRVGMAKAIGLRADAGVRDIVVAYAHMGTDFLRGMYELAYPRQSGNSLSATDRH